MAGLHLHVVAILYFDGQPSFKKGTFLMPRCVHAHTYMVVAISDFDLATQVLKRNFQNNVKEKYNA